MSLDIGSGIEINKVYGFGGSSYTADITEGEGKQITCRFKQRLGDRYSFWEVSIPNTEAIKQLDNDIHALKSALNSKAPWYQKIALGKRVRLFFLEFKRDVRGDPTIKTKTTKRIERWLNCRNCLGNNSKQFKNFVEQKRTEPRRGANGNRADNMPMNVQSRTRTSHTPSG